MDIIQSSEEQNYYFLLNLYGGDVTIFNRLLTNLKRFYIALYGFLYCTLRFLILKKLESHTAPRENTGDTHYKEQRNMGSSCYNLNYSSLSDQGVRFASSFTSKFYCFNRNVASRLKATVHYTIFSTIFLKYFR